MGLKRVAGTARALALLIALSAAIDGHAQERPAGRLRPPAGITCSRDELTSFTGKVTSFTRGRKQTALRMRTDEHTSERFVLKTASNEELARLFLMRGESFQGSDWKFVEAEPGKLRPGMRATVWQCRNGSLLVDWQPPPPAR